MQLQHNCIGCTLLYVSFVCIAKWFAMRITTVITNRTNNTDAQRHTTRGHEEQWSRRARTRQTHRVPLTVIDMSQPNGPTARQTIISAAYSSSFKDVDKNSISSATTVPAAAALCASYCYVCFVCVCLCWMQPQMLRLFTSACPLSGMNDRSWFLSFRFRCTMHFLPDTTPIIGIPAQTEDNTVCSADRSIIDLLFNALRVDT